MHLANALLVAALAAAAAVGRSRLPARIPVHFDPGGQPTRWAETTALAWYGLPLTAAATALLLWGVGRMARRNPSLWNVPEKERFVRLPPDARAPFQAELERMLGAVGVLVTLTFAAVQLGMYLTATGRPAGFGPALQAAIWTPMVAVVVLAVAATRRLGPRIRAAADRDGIRPGSAERT